MIGYHIPKGNKGGYILKALITHKYKDKEFENLLSMSKKVLVLLAKSAEL